MKEVNKKKKKKQQQTEGHKYGGAFYNWNGKIKSKCALTAFHFALFIKQGRTFPLH